jgi:hypothetical protein
MNIEKLCRNALDFLKSNYPNFPKSGFIAGGSLGNLIWEQVSGNIAKINDIDVFIFDKVVDRNYQDVSNWINASSDSPKKLFYHKKEKVYYEDYSGLCVTSQSKDFYYIESTSNEGIYNFVNYSANRRDPQVIIDSFDINCTQVGYSISEDKFYYTQDFVDFLKTGNLKLTNLMSPAHSAIRLVKKKHDLNSKLDEVELKMCQYVVMVSMQDTTRRYFTEKYATNYRKYESELAPYFTLKKDDSITELFKVNKGLEIDIFTLEVPVETTDEKSDDYSYEHIVGSIRTNKIFNDEEVSKIYDGQRLLFYIRNIQGSNSLKQIWKNLKYLYDNKSYVDGDFSVEDVEMLHRLTQVAPLTIKNLKGLRLSQQISIMKNLFDKYKEDPIVAISIMEKMKIDPDKDFDEGDLLLLELSVRKEIVNDVKHKAKRIFEKDK